jgi:hypothetical protein
MHICSVTIHSLGTGNQIMRVNAGSALDANLETAVDSGGRIELAGGALSTSELDILGTTARVGGYGTVTGDITNSGIVTGSVLGVLVLDGGSFTNGVGAFLTAPFGSFVVVQSNSVSQSGQIEVDASAGLLVDQPLVNSPGATISILGGSLATLQLTNQSSADVEGFGLIQADVTNAGDIVLISDTEVVGNVQNDGTITIQNGLLTITGTLSGSGTIYGDFSGPGPVPGVAGLTVISDVMLAADSTLTIANGLVRVGGSFDVAINDPAGLDLTTTTVQLVGLPEDLQTLETPAADFGSTVTLPDADLYSLATLRIGPTPAVVKLVDDHDNSPGAGSEALYVEGLVLDDGITLDLNGLRIYYGAVTPEDPFNPGSGVTIIDSVGGGDLIPLSSCVAFSDCADLDDNGVRDDACVWWGCNGGACAGTDIVFADMGGAFGACAPDGTADGNDRFHALNCFSDSNTQGAPGYPCEVNPPVAYNVDAGGPFGNCSPDGVCDGNDAFHAINAFSGVNTCSCPLDGGPGPDTPSKPGVVAFAGLRLVANPSLARSGGVVEVEVYLDGDLPDIRGYQLHLGVSGGNAGRLELVDIAVHDRKDAVFAGLAPWRAFNIQTGQMVAGLDSAGIAAPAGAYLATFTFQVSADAAGAFTIELLHDENDRSQRTFLFPTPTGAKIQIESVKPAVVTVEPASEQARRAR